MRARADRSEGVRGRVLRRLWLLGGAGLALGLSSFAWAQWRSPGPASSGQAARKQEPWTLVERIYDKGLVEPWEDHGWTDHQLQGPGPARAKFGGHGGWIIAHGGELLQDALYGAIVFKMKAPPDFGDFLELRLEGDGGGFEAVKIGPEHRRPLEDGWVEVLIPLRQLNPYGVAFNKVRLRAYKRVSDQWVLFQVIGLTGPRQDGTPKASYPERPAAMTIRCDQSARAISPWIYGVGSDSAPEDMNASAQRLGGNRMSRYNWELSAVNTGLDWYYRNVPSYQSHLEFIERGVARKAYIALTVPTIGWVAKDASSYSFPVSVFGPQQHTAPESDDMGNGVDSAGKDIPPGPPTRTSLSAPPEMMRKWVESIRALEAKRGATLVNEYILDNEPALWNSTHRDVHPEPLTYDELLDRTIRYGTAVRAAAPHAIISGPAEWGWPGYFWSAQDAVAGFSRAPDRKAHGDVPLLDWYLQHLREHERKTGVRILDVVDLHFYPQGSGIFSDAADADTVARRLRATRALWDPSYVDESWIQEPIRLIPRVKEIIAKNYPGRGLSIGEWNFGGEGHVSGGLATAETLGRFAEGGVRSAFYWTTPKKNSGSYWGFRAFRNYDGAGGRFLDELVESTAPEGSSLFVSRDPSRRRLVAVAINLNNLNALRATLDTATCGAVASYTVHTWAGSPAGFVAVPGAGSSVGAALPPYSIAVFDIRLRSGDAGP